MTANEETPLWRFTRFLDYVLIAKEDGWKPIAPGNQRFVVLGRAQHPSGAMALAGELVGGPNCGLRFLFDPADEANWEQIAVRA